MLVKLMASALALTGAAYAQETPQAPAVEAASSGSDRVAYDAAFFGQFNPQNALDIVRNTPGFSLDGGDTERRGFSGAVGNLLIDGLRPSAKTQSLDNILSQIPATQVVRVEVLRGAAVSGDASGASVLINIVRTPSAGSGLWNLGVGHHAGVARPFGDASYTGRRGQFEYGIGGNWFQDYREQPGQRRYYDGVGTLTNTVLTPGSFQNREANINANFAMPLLGGRLSATGQAFWYRFTANHQFQLLDADGVYLETLYDEPVETRPRPGFEVGLNYDRDFGPWSLALVGLANRTDFSSHELATTVNAAGAQTSLFDISTRRDSGESILRGSLARAISPTQRLEFNLEGAINTLDASLDISEDTGSGPVALDIPNANVTVEEKRAEASIVHTWRPDPLWSVETRLAREQSTLTFTGDQNQTVDLSFWKPSLQVTRSFGENNQARVRLYRDVGQLDFDDFVSATEVTNDLIAGGNPDLEPETSYRAELGVDFRFSGGAALSLTYTRGWLEDVADFVYLIDDRGTPGTGDDIPFDAPGNIGDADTNQLDASLTLPLNNVLQGLRFTASGYLWQGEVIDPVTGRSRTLSERQESQLDFEIRQDLPAQHLAWSITLTKPGEIQFYRFNEIDTSEEGPWVDGYIETSALPHGMRLRLTAVNIFDGDIRRNRQFFRDPDRNGPRTSYEERNRHFPDSPWFEVRLSGTF